MSRYVSIQRCTVQGLYGQLIQAFSEFISVERFEQILNTFGEVRAERFYVLDNQYTEDYNSFQNLFTTENVAYVGLKTAFERLEIREVKAGEK